MEFIIKHKEARQALVEQAEAFIGEGKLEDSSKIMEDIKALDVSFEAQKLEMANLNAIKEDGIKNSELENTFKGDINMKQVEKLENGIEKFDEVVAFAKIVKGDKLTPLEAQNVHTTGNSAVAIPQTLLNEVIGMVSEQYPLFGDARKFQVQGLLKLPKHVAITAGDANFYTEDVETVNEENTFVEVTLGGVEVAKLITVSFKLEAMSIPAFITYLRGELVSRIGALVGTAVYTGVRSSGQFEGAVAVAVSAGQNVTYPISGVMTYDTIADAMAKLASQFSNGASIYVNNQTLWSQIAKIKDLNGSPIFVSNPVSGGVGTVFGLTVKVDGGAPSGTVVIANAQEAYAINTNQSLELKTGENLTKRHTEMLAYGIMDGAVTNENAMVVIAPA